MSNVESRIYKDAYVVTADRKLVKDQVRVGFVDGRPFEIALDPEYTKPVVFWQNRVVKDIFVPHKVDPDQQFPKN